MIRLAPLLLLALPACSDAEAVTALAECRAQLEQYVADRQDYAREAVPQLGADVDGENPTPEQMEQVAALHEQLEAYDNMIRVQELRCNRLERAQ